MYIDDNFHTPQWLGNEIVSATLCTNTGLQNITRPTGVNNARQYFDYLEIGRGPRKIRLYSTADAVFIRFAKTFADLRVQPRAASFYSRYLVDKSEATDWSQYPAVPDAWLVFDGLELSQGTMGPVDLLAPFLLNEGEVLQWIGKGAIVLNVGNQVYDVLSRLEEMRQYRLRDRGKTRDEISPEQAARQIRQMEKNEALK